MLDGNERAHGIISVFLAFLLLCALAFPLAKARAAGVTGTAPNASVEQQETDLLSGMHLYFGNLHSHTGNSDGQGTPAEAFAWARDTAKFDFYAVTDHAEYYMDSSKWADTGAQADSFNQDGRFVALRGFEYSNPYGGHVCVWNTASYTNAILSPSVSLFYAWLAQNNGVAQFNHPGREPGVFNNLGYEESVAGDMCAIEVGNKGDSITGNAYYPYYSQALDKGWRVGPSSNQDNHTLNANSHRTVLVSPELTRAGLLDALEQRRFYSTDDPDMQVIFKSGGNWMGSTVQLDPGNTTFSVLVSDDEPITKLELVGGGGQVVQVKDFDVNQASEQVTWNPTVDVQASGYYFLKVTERDLHNDEGAGSSATQMAVTAPIWVDLKIHEPEQLPAGNWYKGDLHSHSTYSDGDCDVATVVSIAEGKGLDFFALTDHQTDAAWNDPGYRSNQMTLLNAIEWTTSNGHANIWSNKPFDISSIIPTWQDPGDAKNAIDIAHSLAGEGQKILFSLNHPYSPGCEWNYSFEDSENADSMEVWNAGYVWPNLNFLSDSQILDQYYGQRKRISMVGGSDSHYHKADWINDPLNAVQTLYHDIGMPTTWVYAQSNSAYDILDGIQKGHVFISHSSNGPQLQLFADANYQDGGPTVYGIMMGDSIPRGALGKEVRFRAVVKDAKMTDILAGPSLLVVIKNGTPLTATVGMSADYSFDFNDTPQEGDYYRVELRQLELTDTTLGDLTQLGWVVALTNPIYAWEDPAETPPAPAPQVASITPDQAGSGNIVNISDLVGSDFKPGASVKLAQAGQSDIVASNVNIQSPEKISCDFDLQGAAPGAWDVVVTNPDAQIGTLPGGFHISAPAPTVTSLTPQIAINTGAVNISDLAGADFQPGAAVALRKKGNPSVIGTDVSVVSPSKITCRFDLAGVAPGLWDVAVTNPDGQTGGKVRAFTVVGLPSVTLNAVTTRYFAEGYTGSGFQEYLCLVNPQENPAHTTVTYLFNDGTSRDQDLTLDPGSRCTIDVNRVVGEGKEVSSTIVSDQRITAERPIYFNYRGLTGGHDTAGAEAPSKTWYFAEGYTGEGFEQFITVLNPGDSTAGLDLCFQTPDRGEQRVQGLSVPAHTRSTFKVNDLLGAGRENSLKLDATQPVVAERPMYFDYLGTADHHWNGGHCVVGVPALSNEYYFAEGSTRWDSVSSFEEWLTLQNTNDSPMTINAFYELQTGQGGPVEKTYTVPAHERMTVFVPDEVGRGKDVSVRLSSPSTFLAERPIYFSYGASGASWQGGHCVSGAARPAGDWIFAEGCTYPGFQEYLCLQNPGDQDAIVEITYATQESGVLAPRNVTVPARSRVTIRVNDNAGNGYQLASRLRVASGPDIVAERPIYFFFNGWDGGHDVIGSMQD